MVNLVYCPPNGDHKELENYFKCNPLETENLSHKDIILAGDFHISLLGFDASKKVKNFVNLMLCSGMIPTINEHARVARQTVSTIDYIIAYSIMHNAFKSGIIKTDISDNLPLFFCYKYVTEKEDAKKEFIYKRRFSDQSTGTFCRRIV